MTDPDPCPDPTHWQAALEGALPEEQLSALLAHLEACPRCQQTLEGLAAGSETWTTAARHLAQGTVGAETSLRRVQSELEADADPPPLSADTAADAEMALDFLAPPEEPDQLGRLGHYAVSAVIGRGGMGVVLQVFDQTLHRVVAIKVLAPQLASSATARRRFVREARAAAAVRNEHVIDIHAVEESAQPPYLVMEYVRGVSLQERLDRSGPLQLEEVLRIGIQAASGLAAAHAQGLVHRDIKPANILLENGVERVKLTDFGLARAVDDASLTQSGVIAGTPEYMAPEQARGEDIDHRADLFSLGSVLYAMCAGRPPFRASGSLAVLKRVCEDNPRPLREINPEVPAWLTALIDRLHAKSPADRFQSAAEVAARLSQFLASLQQPTPTRPAAKASRQRCGVAAAFGLLGVALALGVAAQLGLFRPAPTPVAPAPPPAPPAPAVSAPLLPSSEAGPPLPPEEQVQTVIDRLKKLNPGLGTIQHITDGHGVVRKLEFEGGEIEDLAPVKALTRLVCLDCRTASTSKLTDLAPLRGLPLRSLNCRDTLVKDLSPLQGMPLEALQLSGSQVSDLTPLKDMPLTVLVLGKTAVRDLAPLQGMRLKLLNLHETRVSNLSPLAEMVSLEELMLGGTPVTDLSPLKGLSLKRFSCRSTGVRDLSPLRGMPLEAIGCRGSTALDADVVHQNLEVLRSLRSLVKINEEPAGDFLQRFGQSPQPRSDKE